MRPSSGHLWLRLLGAVLTVAGFLAWIRLGWKAISDLEEVTPQSAEGGQLMVWALSGTVLMISGMIVLHLPRDAEEREEPEEHGPTS
jgi:hypothetical protein